MPSRLLRSPRALLGDLRGRALWVVIGCLVCQLGLGFGYAISPLAPDILAEFGWTRAVYASAQGPQALLLDYGLLALSSLLLLGVSGGGAIALWGFVLVFGFSCAARDVVTPLIIVHCFGSRSLAQIYGLLMLTILPGSNLGAIFTGWTHDRTGSYQLAFVALAAQNAATFALLFAVRDERRARPSPIALQ